METLILWSEYMAVSYILSNLQYGYFFYWYRGIHPHRKHTER